MLNAARRPPRWSAAVAAAVLVAAGAGCAGSDDDRSAGPGTSEASTSTAPPSTAPPSTDEPAPSEPLADQTPPLGTNGITFDADGRLWIADLAGSQILAVDPDDGAILVRLGTSAGVTTPDDLAFDPDGRLWWTDNVSGAVGRIDDPSGPGPRSSTVAEVGQGANPIAISADGSVMVARAAAGDALYRLDPDDPSTPVLVKDLAGQLNGFDFGSDGRLFAPRFVGGSGAVAAIDPRNGDTTDLSTGLPLTVSVKVAPDDTLRALSVGPATVWKVDPRTGERTVVTELPSPVADNQAFDEDGALWVSAFDRPIVWRLDPAGGAQPVPLEIGRAVG